MPTVSVVVLLSIFAGVGIAVWPSISATIEEAGKPNQTVEFEGFVFDVPKQFDVTLVDDGKEVTEKGKAYRRLDLDAGNNKGVLITRKQYDLTSTEYAAEAKAQFDATTSEEAALAMQATRIADREKAEAVANELNAAAARNGSSQRIPIPPRRVLGKVETYEVNGLTFATFTEHNPAKDHTSRFTFYRRDQFEIVINHDANPSDTKFQAQAEAIVKSMRAQATDEE